MKPIEEMKKEIREAVEAATPGPWLNHYGEFVSQAGTYMAICRVNVPVVDDHVSGKTRSGGRGSEQPNKHLIANAPTWLISLLDHIDYITGELALCKRQIAELEKENTRLSEENDQLLQDHTYLTARLKKSLEVSP